MIGNRADSQGTFTRTGRIHVECGYLHFDSQHAHIDPLVSVRILAIERVRRTDYLYVSDSTPDTSTVALHSVVGDGSEIMVYPNPAKEKITVEGLPQGQVECTLTNAKGSVVIRRILYSDGKIVMPINRKTRGTHTLKIILPTGKEFLKKLILN